MNILWFKCVWCWYWWRVPSAHTGPVWPLWSDLVCY